MFSSIGFIGIENIDWELVRIVDKGAETSAEVLLSNRTASKSKELCKMLTRARTSSDTEIAKHCDLIILAGEQQKIEDVFEKISPTLSERKDRFVLASMVVGLPTCAIQEMAGNTYPVIRFLPNILPEIGTGITQYCGRNTTQEELDAFQKIMEPSGLVDNITEDLIDAANVISEVVPVFCAIIIEALVDGCVACGLPSSKAQKYTAQIAKTVSEAILITGIHPSAIKDLVCSPSGIAIRMVQILEMQSFRAITMNALIETYEKSLESDK